MQTHKLTDAAGNNAGVTSMLAGIYGCLGNSVYVYFKLLCGIIIRTWIWTKHCFRCLLCIKDKLFCKLLRTYSATCKWCGVFQCPLFKGQKRLTKLLDDSEFYYWIEVITFLELCPQCSHEKQCFVINIFHKFLKLCCDVSLFWLLIPWCQNLILLCFNTDRMPCTACSLTASSVLFLQRRWQI